MIGSAQLRRGGAFLQHGSILLGSDPARLESVLGGSVERNASTDLSSVLGRDVDRGELDAALVAAFGEIFGVALKPGSLSAREQTRATQLRGWKHLTTAWTLDGRLGKRERRWGPVAALELNPAR
jgi:lipoate-protein ligase A